MTWQPIETAPKDETYWGIVYFPCPATGKMKVAEALHMVVFDESEPDWFMLPHTDREYCIPPTHWQPLPEPPTDKPCE